MPGIRGRSSGWLWHGLPGCRLCVVDAVDHVVRALHGGLDARVLPALQLDIPLQDPGLDGKVSGDLQVLVVVDSPHRILIDGLAEDASGVGVWKDLAVSASNSLLVHS